MGETYGEECLSGSSHGSTNIRTYISGGKMSELLNQKSSVQGKVPSGYFNALFGLSGLWLDDAKDTKCLAFDKYFVSLYNLHLATSPLVLRDEVKKAVLSNRDPNSLSSYKNIH
ncbi:hypothetical protein QJS10_CPA06g01897 [Acorus calamus]|uniref:MACPF domain-containing protein n=1 Tax=Acorus calamus TaxID=4465 RepID=A0AAV9EMZ5_ACOCL|nr:hypothetical protein QJS10_CPA06g01897 [Acorus calamus]